MKEIPAGSKGEGLRALKKEAPQVVKGMGFKKKGGTVKKTGMNKKKKMMGGMMKKKPMRGGGMAMKKGMRGGGMMKKAMRGGGMAKKKK